MHEAFEYVPKTLFKHLGGSRPNGSRTICSRSWPKVMVTMRREPRPLPPHVTGTVCRERKLHPNTPRNTCVFFGNRTEGRPAVDTTRGRGGTQGAPAPSRDHLMVQNRSRDGAARGVRPPGADTTGDGDTMGPLCSVVAQRPLPKSNGRIETWS